MKKYNQSKRKRIQNIALFCLALIGLLLFFAAPETSSVFAASIAAIPFFGKVADGNFKELSAEEVSQMDAENQIKYFNELNQYRAKKLESLREDLEKKNTDEIKTQIAALKSEIEKANREQFESLTKALETQGMAIRKLMAGEGKESRKTLLDIIKEKKDDISKASIQNPVKFTVNKADVLTSSVADSTIGMREQRIGQIARAANMIRPILATGVISEGMGGVIYYIDQATNTNGAAMQTEGALKGEGAITWVEKTMPLQTIAEWIPVSKQALADFSFIESEIRNKLIADLAFKVEDELWDGTGVAPELKGLYTSADTYTADASGITDASIYDLIVKVHEDISGSTNYQPNFAIMNIADVNKMKLKKDANNNYVMPPFAGANQVDGITVIASSQVTPNTMLVGDFTKATLYGMGNVEITIGWQNQQFVKNMVTILAEERLGLLVRDVEKDAFRKVTDIDAALVTLAS